VKKVARRCHFIDVKAAEFEKEKWIVCSVANRFIMYAMCCAELGIGIYIVIIYMGFND